MIVSGFLLCYLLKAKKIQGIFFLSGIGILAFNSEPPQQFSSGEFSIRFIDVGQGLAVRDDFDGQPVNKRCFIVSTYAP